MSVVRREEAGVLAGESPGVMVKLFDVEEYHRMAEAGILHEDDHVELVEGRLFNNKTATGGCSMSVSTTR
jgi:hypothetical protein